MLFNKSKSNNDIILNNMRRLHAWSKNKKGEFNIPVYHVGPWWAVLGEEITLRIINFFFDINHWFEKFTREYEDKKPREKP